MIIAFDVDGTLIDFEDNPRSEIVALAASLLETEHVVIVWSGGGQAYAETVASRLGLENAVCMSKYEGKQGHVDIAFDDDEAACLAEQMLVVGRRAKFNAKNTNRP